MEVEKLLFVFHFHVSERECKYRLSFSPWLAGAESGLHCLLCADALEGSDGGDQERKPSGRGAQRQSISCKGEKANM